MENILSREHLNDIKYLDNVVKILTNRADLYSGFRTFVKESFDLAKDCYEKDIMYNKNKSPKEYIIQDLADAYYNATEYSIKRGGGQLNAEIWDRDAIAILLAYCVNRSFYLFGEDYFNIPTEYIKAFKSVDSVFKSIPEEHMEIYRKFLGNKVLVNPTKQNKPTTKSKSVKTW